MNELPGVISPLSKVPSSAVILCGCESSFVQTTVSPSSIVILSGFNAPSPIETDISSVSPHSDAVSHREEVVVMLVVIVESHGWESQRSSTPSLSSSASK